MNETLKNLLAEAEKCDPPGLVALLVRHAFSAGYAEGRRDWEDPDPRREGPIRPNY
jgi:hypothetical protein